MYNVKEFKLKLLNIFERSHKNNTEELRDKIEDLIEESEEAENIDDEDKLDIGELSLVSNVLKLRDLTVKDIMIPRAEIVSATENATLEDFIEIFTKSGYSQIPVYSYTLDNVIGVVRIRDFIPYTTNSKVFALKDILQEVSFIVPSLQLLELLIEMRTSKMHMALVVDEFGGVDGLVTLEDVVSKIVGEINSHQILPKFEHRSDGSFLIDARYSLTSCSEKLDIDLLAPFIDNDDELLDIDTVGGLVAYIAGRVPKKGEIVEHPSNIEFEIADSDPRKIKQLILRYK